VFYGSFFRYYPPESGGKHSVMVWCPSFRLSVPSAHTQRDSPGGSTRCGQRTFKDLATAFIFKHCLFLWCTCHNYLMTYKPMHRGTNACIFLPYSSPVAEGVVGFGSLTTSWLWISPLTAGVAGFRSSSAAWMWTSPMLPSVVSGSRWPPSRLSCCCFMHGDAAASSTSSFPAYTTNYNNL